MGQTWTDDTYDSTHEADTDLANIEVNFATLKSNFSGAGGPSNPVTGQLWFDTTKKLLKVRNNANGAWLGVMAAPATQKVWVYANAAPDGWAIDGSVTDRVLALKGGATYVTGGAAAGSWTISGLAHTHGVAEGATGVHQHTLTLGSTEQYAPVNSKTGWHQYAFSNSLKGEYTNDPIRLGTVSLDGAGQATLTVYGTVYRLTSAGEGGHTHSLTNPSGGGSDGAWRTAAAVGTLQYPDV